MDDKFASKLDFSARCLPRPSVPLVEFINPMNDKESMVLYPGGHFNFVCTGVFGHTIGKLNHSRTKAGPSISRNKLSRLCTIKHEPN